FRNAERAGRGRDHLLADVLSGDHRRRTGIDRLPAGEGADALGDRAGVARAHHDVLDAAAEMIGDDLRQRGAGALALGRRAGCDRGLAVRHDADGDALERPQARAFDIIADADAEVSAFGAGLALPGAK